jgi:hypothetical protein
MLCVLEQPTGEWDDVTDVLMAVQLLINKVTALCSNY